MSGTTPSSETAAPPGPPRRAHHREPPVHDGPFQIFRGLLEIVVVASFLTAFVVQPFRIPSASMEPTLRVGDFLLLDRQSYAAGGRLSSLLPPGEIRRGDMVVFHFRVDPNLHLVKRVIGLPGDRLHLHDGHVFVNGAELQEPYAFYSDARPNRFRDDFPSLEAPDPNVDPPWWLTLRRSVQDGELTVPGGEYFVMGDNRNNSQDSRYWGFVPREAIVGRPLLVYFAYRPTDGPASFAARVWSVLQTTRRSVRVVR